MLNILVVEDEPLFAETLKYLVELNPRYVVTDVAEDYGSALAALHARRPDLALVDLQLARGSTGFSVAEEAMRGTPLQGAVSEVLDNPASSAVRGELKAVLPLAEKLTRAIGGTGLPVIAPRELPPPGEIFVLVYVSSRGARQLISGELRARGYRAGIDFLLCA